MYQLNLLAGDGQEITQIKHRGKPPVSTVGFVLTVDPRLYFPEPLWVAGGVIAFDSGKGTRLLLTSVSD